MRTLLISSLELTANPVVTLIIGAVLGFGFAVLKDSIAFKREERRRRRSEQLAALRELNRTMEKWTHSVMQYWGSVMGTILSGQLKEMNNDAFADSIADIEFQVAIYAPELKPHFDRIHTAHGAAAGEWFDSAITLAKGENTKKHAQKIAEHASTVKTLGKEFQNRLITYTQEKCG